MTEATTSVFEDPGSVQTAAAERPDGREWQGALVRPFGELVPRIDSEAWLAPGSVVIGDVEIGCQSSVWYGSVLRGDVHSIRIGARSNIQDQCMVHVTSGLFPTEIRDDVTVGHRAVVHGCSVGNAALVGIGAVVLDGARIGAGALVGAGAVVTPGSEVPAGTLVLGAPARVVRELGDDELAQHIAGAKAYVENARRHARALRQSQGGEIS
jgi:carbonic anhydrase/acetyltransferase-like protein (isoleucine patch superfamily)